MTQQELLKHYGTTTTTESTLGKTTKHIGKNAVDIFQAKHNYLLAIL